jgi:hypothetical protein
MGRIITVDTSVLPVSPAVVFLDFALCRSVT